MDKMILAKDIIYCVNKLLDNPADAKISNLLHRRIMKLLEDMPLWVKLPVPVWKDIDFCITLISEDWWYHWSHLDFSIIPKVAHESGKFSNPLYTLDGKPISFTVSLNGYGKVFPQEKLCLGIIGAYAKYLLAKTRIVEAKALGIYRHVDTGMGPIMVSPDGTFHKIPYDKCLKLDGTLRDRELNGPAVEIPVYIPKEFL